MGEDRALAAGGRAGRPEAFASFRRREGDVGADALAARLRPLLLPLGGPGAAPDVFWTGPDAAARADLEPALSAWPAGTHQTADAPSTFLPRALATRALLPGPWRCQLRTGDLTHPRVRAAESRGTWRPAAVAAAFAAAACGLAVLHAREARIRHEALQEELTRQAAALAPGRRLLPGREAQIACEAVAERQAAAAPLLRLLEGPSLTVTLAPLLEALHQRDARVEELALEDGRVRILAAEADDLASALTRRLPNWGFQARPEPPDRVRIEGRPGP